MSELNLNRAKRYTDANGGSGAVSTDNIWDAVGDLAVGTGANTAARLAIGSNGDVLTVTAGTPAWSAPSGGSGLTHPQVLARGLGA